MYVTRPLPFSGYCSVSVRAMVTKFRRVIGRVHTFVVLLFRARATNGVPSARAQLCHWFNIRRPLVSEIHVHRQPRAHKPHLQNRAFHFLASLNGGSHHLIKPVQANSLMPVHTNYLSPIPIWNPEEILDKKHVLFMQKYWFENLT